MPTVADFQIGQKVTWVHEARGGYGAIQHVAGIVRSIGKRVTIEVAMRHTLGVYVRVLKRVTPDRLKPREKPCPWLGE